MKRENSWIVRWLSICRRKKIDLIHYYRSAEKQKNKLRKNNSKNILSEPKTTELLSRMESRKEMWRSVSFHAILNTSRSSCNGAYRKKTNRIKNNTSRTHTPMNRERNKQNKKRTKSMVTRWVWAGYCVWRSMCETFFSVRAFLVLASTWL